MSACFIFGALPMPSLPVLPRNGDFVIAADKGFSQARAHGITPDLVLGDFDSLGFTPENALSLPVRKDETDVGFALRHARENGFTDCFVFGALGGQSDHTLANLQHSVACAKKGMRVIFFGENEAACSVKDGALVFPPAKGRISVFALGEKAEGVTLQGLSFPVQNAVLSPDFPLGVSNALIGREAVVRVRHGCLTVLWQASILP
ncbi:MAG: thiamine diphosphokinase, partial [Clostridia bacterium]|nr:thiamine diphosphokinase [Clostridia bacterium]